MRTLILYTFAASMLLGTANLARAEGKSSSNPPAPAPAALPVAPAISAAAPSLLMTNLFDKNRQVWPDRIPPPPPPAPPPAPAAITDEDLQVYGVVITPEAKRATVRVGQRFSSLASPGRFFAVVTEGQALGEFTLTAIHVDHLALSAPGGEQRLYFTRKTDRGAAAAVAAAAPVQGPTNPSPEVAANGVGAPSRAGQPKPEVGGGVAASNNGAQLGPQNDGNAVTPAAPAPFNLRNSLAATLEAARNNAQREGAPANNSQANPFQK